MTIPKIRRDPSWTYKLQGNFIRCFYTGILPDNNGQFLLGPHGSNAVLVLFEIGGDYRGWEYLIANEEPGDEECDSTLLFHEHFSRLQDERKCELASIRLKRFRVEIASNEEKQMRFFAGIRDAPFHYERLVERWNTLSHSEESAHTRDIEQWMASGCFVFEWGNEFHVDSRGIIVSS